MRPSRRAQPDDGRPRHLPLRGLDARHHHAARRAAVGRAARRRRDRSRRSSSTTCRRAVSTAARRRGCSSASLARRRRRRCTIYTPLLGAELDLPPRARARRCRSTRRSSTASWSTPAAHGRRHEPARTELAYVRAGATSVRSAPARTARLLLLGGAPFGERSSCGGTSSAAATTRSRSSGRLADGCHTHADPGGRFGVVDYDGRALPAPEMPTVRLKPRS